MRPEKTDEAQRRTPMSEPEERDRQAYQRHPDTSNTDWEHEASWPVDQLDEWEDEDCRELSGIGCS